MTAFFSTMDNILQTGLIFSLIAMGYYISFTLLDFPDLTMEGTFLTGAAVYGVLVMRGVNAYPAFLLAFLAGCACGALTGFLHVKLHIRPLLCGILVSTALISVNLLVVSGGMTGDFSGEASASLSFGRGAQILRNLPPFSWVTARLETLGVALRDLLLFLFFALLFKFLLDGFLGCKRGLLLRAAGNNPRFVTSLAANPGHSRILGLAIGNAFAAAAGALYTHISGNVNQGMGVGTVVIGLSSLLIGLSVFGKVRFLQPTTKVILGAILYQGCLTLALKLGMPSAYNKLIMAVLFTIALVFTKRKNRHSLA